MKSFLRVLVVVSAAGLGVDAQDKKPVENKPDKVAAEKVPVAEIEKLIQQLGSASFSERDAASKALLKLGEQALPSLKAATKNTDNERRGRATALYTRIYREIPMKRKAQIATKYGIDVLVERMVRKGKDVTEEDWQILAEIVATLRADERMKEAQLPDNLPTESAFLEFPVQIASSLKGDKFGTVGSLRVISEKIETQRGLGINSSLVVNAGKIECDVTASVVFVNEDVFCGGGVLGSFVVCDGNITTQNSQHSVLIAREKITILGVVGSKHNVIEDHYQSGMPNIRFFSIRSLGVHLSGGGPQNDGLVGVARVEPGSLLDKAGLRVSDLIASVNGAKLTEVDQAHKLFRRAVAEGTIVIERLGRSTLRIDVP